MVVVTQAESSSEPRTASDPKKGGGEIPASQPIPAPIPATGPSIPLVVEELESVEAMRRRSQEGNGVFWLGEGELGVFDPEAAQKVNALNYRDLTLPDKLADVLRNRTSEPFSWKQLRKVWAQQLKFLSSGDQVAALDARMATMLDQRLGEASLDLTWLAQDVCTQSLIPSVIDGLAAKEHTRVLRDQHYKLERLVRKHALPSSIWREIRSTWIQVAAGSAVRRELKGRAKGKRPRRLDLTDPVVDLLPELGLDRGVDAVTTILTAIAGPPGAAASCLLVELARRPDWRAKLRAELEVLDPSEICGTLGRVAPLTHRFVREALRMWSPPLLMARPVRTDIQIGDIDLKEGQRYLVSTYFVHHDPRFWQDPDTFDPDRWLTTPTQPPAEGACPHGGEQGNGRSPEAASAGGCPFTSDPAASDAGSSDAGSSDAGSTGAASSPYVPFGWAPKSCIGAGLGTIQLMLLCHQFTARYRLELESTEEMRIVLAAVPLPVDFRGTVHRR